MSAPKASSTPLTPLQQALVALEAMQRKLQTLEAARREPIAVIGMACRFPGGANDPERFWQMLDAGQDGLSDVPRDRWNIDAVYDPDPAAAGKMITRRGGFLQGVAVDQFDGAFFGISQREANSMDPQQRLLLELAWEALDDAGLVADRLRESRTGVFVGAMNADYQQLEPTGTPDTYAGPGNEFSFLAGRLAYLLGFRGPSIVVTTACSSSLVALHLAMQSLRLGEADTAFVGGVNLMLSPGVFIGSSRIGALAPDGRCKTFDQAADGYARGEGCAVIVLKRLADAQRDRDRILAVLRGSATNHNGASGGLTVPSSAAQQALVGAALAASGLTPNDIQCVETHGTGTSLGDLIEVQALAGVFGAGPARQKKLLLGSVKANLGHLEAASGLASVIKVILALRHGLWPGQVHFHTPNRLIPWSEIPIDVSAASIPWLADGAKPRRAGVSSFGLSGINCHVIVEEAPTRTSTTGAVGDAFVLPLSARAPAALLALAKDCHEQLVAANDVTALRNLCHTAAVRRSHHDHRLAVTGSSGPEMAARIEAYLAGRQPDEVATGVAAEERWRVVYVFPGQGGQWPGMGGAFRAKPAFTAALAEADRALQPHLGWSVEATLREADPQRFVPIDVVQPLLFAYQLALAALWRQIGVVPDAVVGHSFGEVAAAVVAGALDLDQAAALICHRSRLMARASGHGTMMLVELPWEQAQTIIQGRQGISLAACNGPRATVLSGEPQAIDDLIAELSSRDIFARRVKVDVAAHSTQMTPLARLLVDELAALTPRSNKVPFHSTVIGGPFDGVQLDAAYWGRNMRESVQFWPALRRLVEAGPTLFIELGPHPVLCPNIESALHHLRQPGAALASAQRDAEELGFHNALGKLYVHGVPLRWENLVPTGDLVRMRPYPWQRRRAWWTGAASKRTALLPAPADQHVPAPFVRLPDLAHLPDQHFWLADGHDVRREFDGENPTQHRTRLETLAHAAVQDCLDAGETFRVEDVAIDGPLPPSTCRLQMILVKVARDLVHVTTYAAATNNDATWQRHALVTMRPRTLTEQWLYEVQWEPCKLQPTRAADAGPTIVLADERGLGERLVDKLHARGTNAILVPPESALPRVDPHERPLVLYLRAMDARPDEPEAATWALLSTLQNVLEQLPSARIQIVTCGAQGTTFTRAPEQAPLWGVGRVFALEHPHAWAGLVDLAPMPVGEQAEALLQASSQTAEDQLAFFDAQWHASRLVRAPLATPAESPWRADAIYVVTGGLGGLGLGLIRRMVAGGARHIVTVGRSPLPPRESWSERHADPRIHTLVELEHRGATIDVIAADVADEPSMRELFQSLERRGFPIRGIFHLAGTSTFSSIEQLNRQTLDDVLKAKVRGALVLEACARHLRSLDHFVLFSSAAGVWGSTGQAHYSAANAFLDALARRRRASGQTALSIAWGRLAGGGMVSSETDGFLDRLGLAPMPLDEAFGLLEGLMATNAADRVIAAVDWSRFKPIYNSRRHAPLFDRIDVASDAQSSVADAARGAAYRRLMAAPDVEKHQILREIVANVVGLVLGIDTPTAIDPALGFFRQGMDSIMAIQLRRDLERTLDLQLPPTVAFEHPSVAQLHDHLADILGLSASPKEDPTSRTRGDIDLHAIEQMSEDDAESLLLQVLDGGAPS